MNNDNNINGTVLGSTEPVSTPASPVSPEPTPAENPGFTVMLDAPSPKPQVATPEPAVNPSPAMTPNPQGVTGIPTPASPTPSVNSVPNVDPVPVELGNTEAPNVNANVNPNVNSGLNNGMNNNVTPTPAQPEIQPAYTNPQAIGGMPGFENGGVVGTTPPISLETEKQPQKKKVSPVLFIILIVAALALVGGGVYFLLSKSKTGNATKTTIETKDFSWNLGEELPEDMSYYADIKGTAIENCNKLRDDVDINKAGEYEFAIQCGSTIRKGKITIVDNRNIEVTPLTIYKIVGDQAEAKEFGTSADSDITYEFVNQNEVTTKLSTAGVHTIKVKATSTNNKELEFDAKLIVTQNKIKNYYTCTISSEEVTGTEIASGATKVVDYRFTISDTSTTDTNNYGGLTQEIYTFTLKNKDKYTALKEAFNKDKKVTINNVEANELNATFDDTNSVITIINELDNSTLITTHGAQTFKKYSDLSKHFHNDLGYQCKVSTPS